MDQGSVNTHVSKTSDLVLHNWSQVPQQSPDFAGSQVSISPRDQGSADDYQLRHGSADPRSITVIPIALAMDQGSVLIPGPIGRKVHCRHRYIYLIEPGISIQWRRRKERGVTLDLSREFPNFKCSTTSQIEHSLFQNLSTVPQQNEVSIYQRARVPW